MLGCIDCSHVLIVAPSENKGIYVNRNNGHSIYSQAICDRSWVILDEMNQFDQWFHVDHLKIFEIMTVSSSHRLMIICTI